MATGLLGVLSASGSLTYTAANDAKLCITGTGSSTNSAVRINGVIAISSLNSSSFSSTPEIYHYIGAGQTVTIATDAATQATVSVLES